MSDERARFASFASSDSGASDAMMQYLVGLAEEERSQYAESRYDGADGGRGRGDDEGYGEGAAASMMPRLSVSTDGGSGVWNSGRLGDGADDDDDDDDANGDLYSITPPPPDRRAPGLAGNGDGVAGPHRGEQETEEEKGRGGGGAVLKGAPSLRAAGGGGGGGGSKMRWRRAVDSVVKSSPSRIPLRSTSQLDKDITAVTTTTKLSAPRGVDGGGGGTEPHGGGASDRLTGWHLPDQFDLLEVYRIQPRWMLRPDCTFRMWYVGRPHGARRAPCAGPPRGHGR